MEEWPPVETNFSKARSGLGEAKRCLLNAASEQGKKVSLSILGLFNMTAKLRPEQVLILTRISW